MLNTPHFFVAQLAVKDTSAWAIGRVCDTCERLVVRPDILSCLLPALFVALQDQPRVATNVCWVRIYKLISLFIEKQLKNVKIVIKNFQKL